MNLTGYILGRDFESVHLVRVESVHPVLCIPPVPFRGFTQMCASSVHVCPSNMCCENMQHPV